MTTQTMTANARADHLLTMCGHSWIDGKGVTDSSGRLHHSDPWSGQSIGEIACVDASTVDRAVRSARLAFETRWRILPLSKRQELLHRYADAIASAATDLAALEAMEVGRPVSDALGLISFGVQQIREFANLAPIVVGNLFTSTEYRLGFVRRSPRGVIGIISPWNVPVMNVITRIAPALAAGNAVVVKPSEWSSRSAILLAKLATEAGLPDGVMNVVLGDGAVAGRALAAHPLVNLLSFTGSVQGGRAARAAAAEHSFKPVIVEAGGKSAQLVLDDAIEDDGIWPHIFASAFWNSGQWCAARSRLIVPYGKTDAAIDGLTRAASAWRVGNPSNPDTRLGPLANRRQYERVEAYFADAKSAGRLIELGCPTDEFPDQALMSLPTVVADLPRNHIVVKNEIFGPLLAVQEYRDVEDGLALVNATDFGLEATLWTNDLARGQSLACRIEAGNVQLNTSSAAAGREPEGSTPLRYYEPQRDSGCGPDAGLEGMTAYTRAQAITVSFGN